MCVCACACVGVATLTHPLPQVVGQQQVAGKVVGEGGVELQHLLQRVTLDDVKVAVGQRSYVGARLSQSHLLPEDVTKHVAFTCDRTRVGGGGGVKAHTHSEKRNHHWR